VDAQDKMTWLALVIIAVFMVLSAFLQIHLTSKRFLTFPSVVLGKGIDFFAV